MAADDAQAKVLADAMAGQFMSWLRERGLAQDGQVLLTGEQVALLADAFGDGFAKGATAMARSGLAWGGEWS